MSKSNAATILPKTFWQEPICNNYSDYDNVKMEIEVVNENIPALENPSSLIHTIKQETCDVDDVFNHETKEEYLGHCSTNQSHKSIYSENYECEMCCKSFGSEKNLKKHSKRHNLTTLQCNECLKCFTAKHDLVTHMRIHSGEKPFKCTECPKSFTQRGHLSSHKLTHSGEKFQCSTCLKYFSKDSLKRHEKRHKEEPTFSCKICSQAFYFMGQLKRHQIKHLGGKTYECDQCFKKFNESHDLKRHLRIHAGIKPFECEICLKKFSEKSVLMTHKKLHSSDKPHVCPVCFKGFTKNHNMKQHMHNQHVKKKIYKCLICEQNFSKEFFLKMHEKKHINVKKEVIEITKEDIEGCDIKEIKKEKAEEIN